MKTKKTVLTAVIGMFFLFLSGFGYAVETHPNGWIYPAGTSKQGGYSGWKEEGYSNHVGIDNKLSPGDPVYSLANDGEIVDYGNSLSCYGTACGGIGGAILVKYETADHIVFYAVYGHCYIKEGLRIGSKVSAGEVIGYIHEYYGKDKNGICNTAMNHLHFGIHPNTIDSERPFRGVGTATNDFGWVNPTVFLNEHFPNGLNLMSYDFSNHSSQGFMCSSDTEVAQGNDLSTWQVHITGNNPGVQSPSFSCGLMAKDTVIKFSARVLGNDYSGKALMYLKDERDSWNNEIQVGTVDMSHNYREYTVNLSSARSDLEVKNFSLELTSGGNGNDEYWTLDWLKILSKSTSWDFKDSQLGWTLANASSDNIFTASWGDAFWQIDPTGNDPQIISPYVEISTSLYNTLEIRLSAQGTGQPETLCVFYDFGQGFSSANQATKPIIRNNGQAVYTFSVPNNGVLQRLRIDPIPSGDDTKNDVVFLDYVRFSKSSGSTTAPVQGALIGGPNGTTPSAGSSGGASSSPPIVYNQVLGTTQEGFTIMTNVNTWKFFPGGNTDLATAKKYVNAGQNPSDIIYYTNDKCYLLKPDANPVAIWITLYLGNEVITVDEGNIGMYQGWSKEPPKAKVTTSNQTVQNFLNVGFASSPMSTVSPSPNDTSASSVESIPVTKKSVEIIEKFSLGKGYGFLRTTPYPGSWNAQRNNNRGTGECSSTYTYLACSVGSYNFNGGYLHIDRGYFPFNTSGLPDNAKIISAKLYFIPKEFSFKATDAYSYFVLVASYQQNNDSLVSSDIGQIGTKKLSENITREKLTVGRYYECALNQTGLDFISTTEWTKFCLREGHDLENKTTTIKGWNNQKWSDEKFDENLLSIYTSEAGADKAPYLEIAYTCGK